jgi:hypothetical protein
VQDEQSHFCFAALTEITGQVYSDQTGKFTFPSSNGNNYLCILYDYDSNLILAEPMKSRGAQQDIVDADKTVHTKLCRARLHPKLARLDNECSVALKTFLIDEKINYQLVPPGTHRRNATERAIRTFKNHFIAGLCSVDKDFPLHLWDRLVEQAVITLNLLRGSRLNPRLSTWAQFHGPFDFNHMPIAPPGICVIAHDKPADRDTWLPHGSGISDPLLNPTAASQFGSGIPNEHASPTPYRGSPPRSQCPLLPPLTSSSPESMISSRH